MTQIFCILQNGTLQCPGEVLVCQRDGELQTGIVPVNPGRVVSLIATLLIAIPAY